MNGYREIDHPLDKRAWVFKAGGVSGGVGHVPGDYSELLSSAIEAVGLGIILVAHDGWILYANATARELMRCSRGVRSSYGRLIILAREADARLSDLAKVGSIAIPGSLGKPPIIALRCGEGTQHLFAHTVPGQESCKGAVIFVVDPANYLIPRLNAFAFQYGLTPGEARIVEKVANGRGLVAAAQSLQIAESTARTHLRRVFDKTGTFRQTELLRLYFTGARPEGT
jgi:DNA-binding CsgD family transcriptional regulator